jgi:DNA-binding XRE family transcriptional regulator
MQAHELEALRRLLFFSQPEAARLCEVSEQTWRRWESGRLKIPADVAYKMQHMTQRRQRMIELSDARVAEALTSACICPLWYEEDDWRGPPELLPVHRSACAELLARWPDNVKLVVFERADYDRWRGAREDTDALRQQWAQCKSEAA